MNLRRLCLGLVLALIVPTFTQGMTLKELRDRVRSAINEDSLQTNKTWVDTEINWFINDGVALIEAAIGANQAESTYTLVAGTLCYKLPYDYWLAEGTYIKKNVASTSSLWKEPRPLRHKRIKDLGPQTPTVGLVEMYSVWGDSLMVWPCPNTAEKLVFRYLRHAAVMDSDTDHCAINDALQDLVTYYARAQCWQKSNDARFEGAMTFFTNMLTAIGQQVAAAQRSEMPVNQSPSEPAVVPVDR